MSQPRTSWFTDQKTAALICLALALFAMLPVLLNTSDAPADSNPTVSTARQLPLTLQTLQLRLAEADAAQRNWLITARERHLAAYTSTVEKVKELMTTLRSATEIDRAQQTRFAQLEALVNRRIVEHADLARLRNEKGLPAVAAALSSDTADRTTAEARVLSSAMLADAQQLLRRRDVRVSTARNGRIFSLVAGLNLLILALGFRLVNRFIKQRKGVEQKLQEATDAAQAANTAKTAFLANMSHEIRTPLTAILGYTDMLVDPHHSESERSECHSSIRRNARHLLDLLNDVLDISKIEAGRMTAEKIAFDLPTLAAEVASMMRPRALEKGLNFKLEFHGAIPQKIKSDPVRLKQILVNLVGNAIKFTTKGHVIVSVSAQLHPATQQDTATTEHVDTIAVVRFDVSDTGIGLTPMQIERLFEPFTQADESMTRRFGGSGLGLTISRRLASLLGGAITVQSAPLQGSTFTVQIDGGPVSESQLVRGLTESIAQSPATSAVEPRSQGAAMTAPSSEANLPLKSIRILFAEDGKDNQRLICAHLKRAGGDVTVADNGQIALNLLVDRDFDVILMDMQMPVLDGYGAARAIRQLDQTIPIIALTAHAMSDDREKCIAAGCTDYLTKPVDKNNLIRAITSSLSRRSGDGRGEGLASSDPQLTSEYAADPDMQPLIADFVAAFPQQIAQLESLLTSSNLDELRRQVHQLKGAGGGYGFQRITDLAARAEQSLKSQQSVDSIAAQVRELADLLKRIHAGNPTSPSRMA